MYVKLVLRDRLDDDVVGVSVRCTAQSRCQLSLYYSVVQYKHGSKTNIQGRAAATRAPESLE